MKNKVLMTFQPMPSVVTDAEREFDLIQESPPPTTERVIALANEHQPDALFVAHGQDYGRSTIEQLPDSVRVIATCSVGYEHIDLEACRARGIITTNTPDVLTEACADQAFFVLLGAARRGKEALKLIEKGWGKKLQQGEMLGLDLFGKRLGIIGMGRIGQAVARRARAFGMEILYSNRNRLNANLELGARYFSDMHEMLPHCDVLSLNAPGTTDTVHLMGAKEFSLLPQNAIFVNISRGGLVDEDAIVGALESKKLFAAGLDVCQNEPDPDPRLVKMPNVFLTPHIASATQETRHRMGARALANIRAVLTGANAPDKLN